MTDNEEQRRWEPATIHLQRGDIITSKNGFLTKSAIGKEPKYYTSKRSRYLGNGVWEMLDQPVEVQDVKVRINDILSHDKSWSFPYD